MKLVILCALIALAVAAPVDEKKPEEDPKKTDDPIGSGDDKPMQNQTFEKKDEERKGLQFPLPDPENEGDLMLHGVHLFDRVEELHKSNSTNVADKMILSVGREYLRRVHKYIKETPEFKIMPLLCRDSERLNSSKRWEIRIRPANQRGALDWFLSKCWPFSCSTDDQSETQSVQQTGQARVVKREIDPIVSSNSTYENVTENSNSTNEVKIVKRQTDSFVQSNITNENATENANTVSEVPVKGGRNFDAINKVYYKSMGENFGRVLMRKFRQEKLEQEEIDYLERWTNEESIHYGLMGIYCHDGENLEEITKRISVLIEEQQ